MSGITSKRQKIVIIAVAAALIAVGAFVALRASSPEDQSDKIAIVTTFYPLTYMTESIGGDKVSVSTLVPYNTEVHSWSPSPSDVIKANAAEIIIYNGAGLDEWMEDDLLPAIVTTGKIVVETTHGIELIESGENETEHGDEHDHELYDPHTWISPYIAAQQAQRIYQALVQADAANSSYYAQRFNALYLAFDNLDDEYQAMSESKQRDNIFVSHGAFGYLASRYDFQQESIIGISADEEPSPAVIASLVNSMVSNQTYFVFFDPVFSDAYVNTLKANVESVSGHTVTVLRIYLMTGPVDGLDYLQQMAANLESLKEGLGVA